MYFILVGDNRIAKYVNIKDVSVDSDNELVRYLYNKAYDIEENKYQVIDFTNYKTRAGKMMAHIVLTNKDKDLTRCIVFPTLYKIALGKMREGMICSPVLSKLDDGTLMVKEIK